MDEEDFMEEQMYDNIESNMISKNSQYNYPLTNTYHWYKMIYKSFHTTTDKKYPIKFFNSELKLRDDIYDDRVYFFTKIIEFLNEIIKGVVEISTVDCILDIKNTLILESSHTEIDTAYTNYDIFKFPRISHDNIMDISNKNNIIIIDNGCHISYSCLIELKDTLNEEVEKNELGKSTNVDTSELPVSDNKVQLGLKAKALINIYLNEDFFKLTSKGNQHYSHYLKIINRTGKGTERENSAHKILLDSVSSYLHENNKMKAFDKAKEELKKFEKNIE